MTSRVERMSRDEFVFRIDVPFGPRWQHVELLRMSIVHCVAAVFQNHEFCERLGMVTAELVENAINYGDWGGDSTRPFRLIVRGTPESVVVDVANPIDPSRPNAFRLTQSVGRINSAPTVRDAYAARLREIAENPEQTGSGLGLLRVMHETGCRLDVVVADKMARVVATIARAEAGGS